MPQQRVGWRAYVASTISSLLTSLYGAWNGDTTGTSLDASIFGAWNAEASGTSLDTSIFAVYNADGDANDSKGTNHGTLVNGATFSTGKIGQAFQFDGTNDYLKLPNNSLNFIDDFSVGFWMKLGSLNQTSYIIDSAGFSGIGTTGWVLNLTSGNLNFTIHNNNNASSIGANYVLTSTSVWYHIVITSKSGYNAIYINNSLIMSNTSTMRPNYVASPYSIPYIGVFKTANTQFFNGNIDGLNFWNKSLTVDEVTQLYNSGNGAQYPYSSQSLPSPNDSVGTNHGSLMNGVAFSTGKVGNAFTFDGVNDYVELPANSMNVTGDFTISFWANMRTRDYNNIICNMGNDGVNRGFYIDSDGSYALRFVGYNSGYTLVKTDNSALFDLNVWNHFTFILKNGVGQWYKNGVANGSSGSIVYSLISGNKPIIGGYRTGNSGSVSSNKNMALDAITIWNKAITLDEITQLYNLGTGAQYPFSSQTLPSTMNQLGVDNGTLMNGASLSTGKIGQAFTFDGVNDYVALPDNSLNFTGDFSVSAWIYVANVSGEKFLISNVNGNAIVLNFGWCFGLFNNKLSFGSYGNTVYSVWTSADTLLVNTWYHVLVTKKSSQNPKFYINGNLSTSTLHPNSTGTDSTNPIYSSATYPNIKSSIGTYIYNNGSSTYAYWNGKIDGLSVWQKELTQAEVTELYNSGAGKQLTTTPIVTNGLVLNLDASRTSSYPGSGTTWTDISGSGNNGTMVNGPVFGTASGGVITFDGVNDYVSVADSTSLRFGTGAYTINLWVKPTSFSGSKVLIQKGSLLGGWQLYFDSVGYLHFTQQFVVDISTILFSPNQWKNIVFTSNGGTDRNIYMYVNGVSTGTYTCTGNQNYNLTSALTIGADGVGNNYFLNGNITNVLLYNRALSATEIAQNFDVTKSRFGL